MHIKVVSKGKNKMRLELGGESHTFADAIRQQLSEDKRVISVSYDKHHPQLGHPILVLETEGEDPASVIKKAAKNLAEKSKEVRLEWEKATKRA